MGGKIILGKTLRGALYLLRITLWGMWLVATSVFAQPGGPDKNIPGEELSFSRPARHAGPLPLVAPTAQAAPHTWWDYVPALPQVPSLSAFWTRPTPSGPLPLVGQPTLPDHEFSPLTPPLPQASGDHHGGNPPFFDEALLEDALSLNTSPLVGPAETQPCEPGEETTAPPVPVEENPSPPPQDLTASVFSSLADTLMPTEALEPIAEEEEITSPEVSPSLQGLPPSPLREGFFQGPHLPPLAFTLVSGSYAPTSFLGAVLTTPSEPSPPKPNVQKKSPRIKRISLELINCTSPFQEKRPHSPLWEPKPTKHDLSPKKPSQKRSLQGKPR